jgi:hypothetical protein
MKVICGYAVAYPVDGPHQRRDEHGANDHGGGVHVQSHRGHQNGKDQDPQVGALENEFLLNGLMNVFIFVKIAFKIYQSEQSPEGFVDFHT